MDTTTKTTDRNGRQVIIHAPGTLEVVLSPGLHEVHQAHCQSCRCLRSSSAYDDRCTVCRREVGVRWVTRTETIKQMKCGCWPASIVNPEPCVHEYEAAEEANRILDAEEKAVLADEAACQATAEWED